MGETVLMLYLAKHKESWYQLTEEERDAMGPRILNSIHALGGRVVAGGNCEWSTAEYDFFCVEEYPSVEALETQFAVEREIGFRQHVEETYVVGTPWGSKEPPSDDS